MTFEKQNKTESLIQSRSGCGSCGGCSNKNGASNNQAAFGAQQTAQRTNKGC